MAHLIQMRQRIKAIETIKKITHAMRLIAMSTHSRLKGKEEPLNHYKQAVHTLFIKIQKLTPEWKHTILEPSSTTPRPLIIIVGSQKGLCGGFNSSLFSFVQTHRKTNTSEDCAVIAVGKRAVDYVKEHKLGTLLKSYDEFSASTLKPVAHDIAQTIMKATQPFTHVLIYSNHLKTFFSQRPLATTLIPLSSIIKQEGASAEQVNLEEYIWEQQPEEILDVLAYQYIDAHLQYILFASLLAEHAARFISMDNSTRNAQNLLEATMLDYNKLRQAKITKELSELVGSF